MNELTVTQTIINNDTNVALATISGVEQTTLLTYEENTMEDTNSTTTEATTIKDTSVATISEPMTVGNTRTVSVLRPTGSDIEIEGMIENTVLKGTEEVSESKILSVDEQKILINRNRLNLIDKYSNKYDQYEEIERIVNETFTNNIIHSMFELEAANGEQVNVIDILNPKITVIKDTFGLGNLFTAKLHHNYYFDAFIVSDYGGTKKKIIFSYTNIISLYTNDQPCTISHENMASVIDALQDNIAQSLMHIEYIQKVESRISEFYHFKKSINFTESVLAKRAELRAQKGQVVENNILIESQEKAKKLMRGYALITKNTKTGIINENTGGIFTPAAIKRLYVNQKLLSPAPISGNLIPRNPVDIWMESSTRKAYINTIFSPNYSDIGQAYNTFLGFRHETQDLMDIALFKNFVKDVISSGDDKMYNIVWSFLAQMLQDPSYKMGTALVLLSAKGAGKSVFVKVIGELLSGYFYQSADNKRLLGEFNDHLENTLLFYANELTFTDNKKVIAKLKNLITEENFTYEKKGGATFSAKNYTRVIIDSNDDMVVVQTADERRFIYPLISGHMIGNTEYFNELHKLFESEGFYESLMYDLMNYDYSPWAHYLKTPPKNEVTEEQIMESFSTIESWWLSCIEGASIPYVPYRVEFGGNLFIANESMYQSFAKYTRMNGGRVNLDSVAFGKAFKKNILKDLDLGKTGKIMVSGVRKNGQLYASLPEQAEHFKKIKSLNEITYDGGDWEEIA